MSENYPKEDRDISWLSFNYRVLQEAKNPEVPLYERIKFIAIYSSNLDEFFRVRVASLLSLVRLGKKKVKKNLSINPKKLLKRIHKTVAIQLNEFGDIFHHQLQPALKKEGIYLYLNEEIPTHFQDEITHYFRSRILAFLQPYIFNQQGDEKPFLKNRAIYLAVTLSPKNGKSDDLQFGYVRIPSQKLPRFYRLRANDKKYHYVVIDDMLKNNIQHVFPHHNVINCSSIKLNKSAELNIKDEYAGDLVEIIANQLEEREIGPPSRLLYDMNIDLQLKAALMDAFALNEDEMIPGGRYHNYNDFFEFPNPLSPALMQASLEPKLKAALEKGNSIFEAILLKDQIMHFPYHTYDYVLRFFNEAAIDPMVEEIKVTLYRVGTNSLIANALISAARNGKMVTVFVELKARFDEENNIKWAKKMKKAGINIIYSIPEIKVHAKVALIKRKKNISGIDGYAFLGTGNFNENTASIYADHGLLTVNPKLVKELDHVFNYLQHREEFDFHHLLVAQFNLKNSFIDKINREIENAKAGIVAQITIKLNNLEETAMIDKLYEAANAGVNISLIIRGICCLVPGYSEKIQVFRLVDSYLEHARIFYFSNNGNEEIYLSSADWMHRNLHRRVEVGFPIYDADIKEELKKLLEFQLNDNVKLKRLNQKLENVDIQINNGDPKIRAQYDFYDWLAG